MEPQQNTANLGQSCKVNSLQLEFSDSAPLHPDYTFTVVGFKTPDRLLIKAHDSDDVYSVLYQDVTLFKIHGTILR